MKRIGIIGGTFNPIHDGHLLMAKIALSSLGLEKVFFMPCKNPPWKKKLAIASSVHRLNMIKLLIKENSELGILYEEIDSKSDNVNYTIDTIELLLKKYPDYKIHFIIGLDQLEQLQKWHRVDELSRLVQLVAIKRPNYIVSNENIDKYNVILLEDESIDISSTKVRNKIEVANELIKKYIFDNQLYFEERIQPYMSKSRYLHTISVKERAIEYAKNNKISTKNIINAALLHDICRELGEKQLFSIIEKFFPDELEEPIDTYHQYASSYIARVKFNVQDQATLQSIQKHTTGSTEMSIYDKILYCADKTDARRKFSGLTNLVIKCNNNINDGFIEVLKHTRKYLISNKVSISKKTIAMFNKFLEIKEEKIDG